MDMKCVGEIMIPLEAFPQIPYWFTLRRALAALQSVERERKEQKAVPRIILVLSAQNLLMGTVGRGEIMRGLSPNLTCGKTAEIGQPHLDMTANIDLYSTMFNQERALKQLRNQVERPIVEFMTPLQVTMDCADSLLQVIYCMMERNLRLVPVAKDGQIAGMAYAEDVIGEVIRLLDPFNGGMNDE